MHLHTGHTQTPRSHVSSDEDGSLAATELCSQEEINRSLKEMEQQ